MSADVDEARAALRYLRGLSDDLADAVLDGVQPDDVSDADWAAATEGYAAIRGPVTTVDEARAALFVAAVGSSVTAFGTAVDALIAAVRADEAETLADVVRILQHYEHGRMIDGYELLARMRDRAALAATPAEDEEGRTLVCERNESAASAHGHTAECYR